MSGIPSISKLTMVNCEFDFRKSFKINVDKDELLRFTSQHSMMVELDFGRFIQVTVDDAISKERTNIRKFPDLWDYWMIDDDDNCHEYRYDDYKHLRKSSC